ncbi:hypothetical protein FACS18942_09650 [Planctomycetales bacterium]|nr:hypothetical protein FACS18942_09650 [Planctomycetales bacterium]
MDEFNKRACEAWTEWLVEMHKREEAKRQRRNSNEAEQNSGELPAENKQNKEIK